MSNPMPEGRDRDMSVSAGALLAHVRRLEPHIGERTLLLDLRLDADGRTFHRPGHITEGSTAPGPRPLESFLFRNPCATCLPADELMPALLAAIDDRNLNRAANILYELVTVQRELGERRQELAPSLASISHTATEQLIVGLDEAAVRYLTDRMTLQESRARLLANPVLPQHSACSELVDDLLRQLDRDLSASVVKPENLELLKLHTSREFGIDPDITPVTLQLAAAAGVPSFGDPGYLDELDALDAHATLLPLTLRVLHVPQSLLEEDVVTLPAWAAAAMRLLRPNMIRSSLHRALPDKVLETAIALWSDDPVDLYHHLDHCVSAARSLVQGESPIGALDKQASHRP
jgi:hypothetical protein